MGSRFKSGLVHSASDLISEKDGGAALSDDVKAAWEAEGRRAFNVQDFRKMVQREVEEARTRKDNAMSALQEKAAALQCNARNKPPPHKVVLPRMAHGGIKDDLSGMLHDRRDDLRRLRASTAASTAAVRERIMEKYLAANVAWRDFASSRTPLEAALRPGAATGRKGGDAEMV